MSYKILISGYSGFVGKNLIASLNSKFDIYGLSRNIDNNNQSSIKKIFTWNNLSLADVSEVNCIIHLAGKAHDLKNTTDTAEYFSSNTSLTANLFDMYIKSTATNFIYFSSVKAAADTVDGVLYEDVVPNPQTPYGQSKNKAEEYLLARDLPLGKRLFILRPCMIHGPGNKGNLNLLFKFVQKGIPYPLAAFNNQRSFLSINNLNFIIEKLINNPAIPGGIYNICDDEPLSTTEVIKIIAHAVGLKPNIWKLNVSLVKFIALVGDKVHLPLNTERLKKLTESYTVSNQKIKNALNINQLPTSSEEGLMTTIKSFTTQSF